MSKQTEVLTGPSWAASADIPAENEPQFYLSDFSEHAAAVTKSLLKHDGGVYRLMLDKMEHGVLSEVTAQFRGNQSRMAECLGMNRATLRVKLKRHGFI